MGHEWTLLAFLDKLKMPLLGYHLRRKSGIALAQWTVAVVFAIGTARLQR